MLSPGELYACGVSAIVCGVQNLVPVHFYPACFLAQASFLLMINLVLPSLGRCCLMTRLHHSSVYSPGCH
ncbi:hypothetical protein GUJ93_ZPchr0002g26817 [Zizania palustris]|uniref:Uncharacterized protein n=1 Tax=Zizania palustris TaxID=103762 RepID=A0A8J5V486_ZIZPA|nr:hypothetical protein GUJ93_ZPchr0002g26817 [Zizania palustris]